VTTILGALGGLTKGLRAALPFIESIVNRDPGLSARDVINAARAAGLSFRDAGAFQVIGQLKANVAVRERFRLTDFNGLPSLDSLERALTPLRKDYSFLVRISGFNRASGSREQRFVTVVSDNLLSPAEILQSALKAPSETPGSSPLENATVSIERGMISPLAL